MKLLKEPGSYLIGSMQIQCNPRCESEFVGIQLSHLLCQRGKAFLQKPRRMDFTIHISSYLYDTAPSHIPREGASSCRESGWCNPECVCVCVAGRGEWRAGTCRALDLLPSSPSLSPSSQGRRTAQLCKDPP